MQDTVFFHVDGEFVPDELNKDWYVSLPLSFNNLKSAEFFMSALKLIYMLFASELGYQLANMTFLLTN